MKPMPAAVPYETLETKYLQDKEYALLFLQTALDEGDLDFFLQCFGTVVRARGGISKFASETKLSRQTIHNVLKNKSLRAVTLWELVKALGLQFSLVALGGKKKKPVAARSRNNGRHERLAA